MIGRIVCAESLANNVFRDVIMYSMGIGNEKEREVVVATLINGVRLESFLFLEYYLYFYKTR